MSSSSPVQIAHPMGHCFFVWHSIKSLNPPRKVTYVQMSRDGATFERVKPEPGFPDLERRIGGTDSCIGDSGGPLWNVLGRKYPTAFLIGVVSRGLNCANLNAPGIYERVKKYLAWITKVRLKL